RSLAPGMYSVRELQPDGYFQGGQSLGSGGGVVGGQDLITQVAIGAGVALVDYNFCEVPPSSLAGRVFADPNRDCLYNAGDSPLANVTVQLVDSQGNAVATQQTDSEGHYRFDNLAPGTYSLREVQPTAYFQGGQRAGSGGGNVLTTDQIAEINILGGQSLVDYDFCEQPPAAITGFVYQDGPTIQTADGNAPANLGDLRDGSRTPDDQPIGGVLLQLRDGFTGDPIDGSEALSGTYGSGPIQVRTDANGYFEFRNLPGGRSYAIFQVHPDGYIDSIDTVGTTTGFAFNPQVSQQTQGIEPLAGQPASDAIIRIAVNPGQTSNNNNFSEIRVERSVVPPPPPDPPRFPPNLPPVYTPPEVPAIPSLPGRNDPAPNYLAWSSPRIPVYFQASAGGLGYTWHLSVINGGMPRDLESGESEGDSVWRSANYLDTTMWKADHTRQGRWLVGILPQGSATPETQSVVFGIRGSIPIAGDFNGDGTSEMGLFYRGEWFIDLNGNGQWDEEDLWAKLGDDLDRPVVGDWDGDGKDDIGIYGPEWFGDQRQIDREPGLPDSHNEPAKANAHTNSDAIARTENPKNVPPSTDEATHGERLLRLSRTGPRRSDVIDHVFRYGQERDFPLAGDWNGDGIRTIGIFRDGTWRVDSDGDGLTGPHDRAWTFGAPGDVPVVGDWNGDGIEEIGIYRGGKWILDVNGNRELDAHDKVFQLGTSEDYPVVGDWNGDGIDDPAVYRESAPPIPQTEVRVER
ncbi:MAG: SdrD B-like domain-containing protein, partial [Pirellulaceae bacterium]